MWIIFFSLSQVFAILFSLLSRVYLQKTKYDKAYTIIWEVFFTFTAIIFIPFFKFKFTLTPVLCIMLFVSFLSFSFSNYFRFKAYEKEEASTLAPIFTLSNVFTIIVTIFIFKSVFSINVLIGFFIIVAATFIASGHKENYLLDKDIRYAVLSTITSGIGVAIDGYASQFFSIPIYILFLNIFMISLSQIILLRPKMSEIKYELKSQRYKIGFSAILLCTSYVFLLKSFTYGNVTEIVALRASLTVIVTVLAIIFLNERDRIKEKLISSIIAGIGILFIGS